MPNPRNPYCEVLEQNYIPLIEPKICTELVPTYIFMIFFLIFGICDFGYEPGLKSLPKSQKPRIWVNFQTLIKPCIMKKHPSDDISLQSEAKWNIPRGKINLLSVTPPCGSRNRKNSFFKMAIRRKSLTICKNVRLFRLITEYYFLAPPPPPWVASWVSGIFFQFRFDINKLVSCSIRVS